MVTLDMALYRCSEFKPLNCTIASDYNLGTSATGGSDLRVWGSVVGSPQLDLGCSIGQ